MKIWTEVSLIGQFGGQYLSKLKDSLYCLRDTVCSSVY